MSQRIAPGDLPLTQLASPARRPFPPSCAVMFGMKDGWRVALGTSEHLADLISADGHVPQHADATADADAPRSMVADLPLQLQRKGFDPALLSLERFRRA